MTSEATRKYGREYMAKYRKGPKHQAYKLTPQFRFKKYRESAKERDRAFELTLEQFTHITSQDCFYCDKHPEPHNGIDRIDSQQGYIQKNCLPCCADCNIAKSNMTQDEFFKMVKRIHTKHLQSIEFDYYADIEAESVFRLNGTKGE